MYNHGFSTLANSSTSRTRALHIQKPRQNACTCTTITAYTTAKAIHSVAQEREIEGMLC